MSSHKQKITQRIKFIVPKKGITKLFQYQITVQCYHHYFFLLEASKCMISRNKHNWGNIQLPVHNSWKGKRENSEQAVYCNARCVVKDTM